MNRVAVQQIYDTLFSTESKLKRQSVYPIHKRLNAQRLQYSDIYEWISAEIPFAPSAKVLDAGCGVGYGSILLAKQHNIDITGISLSELELNQARKVATEEGVNKRLSFKLQSFDDVLPNSFDVIIAVESLKHSFDLNKTLTRLKTALRPNGQLVIVEDFYQKQELTPSARKYIADWHLIDAFRLEDYYQVLPSNKCKLTDLTNSMFPKRKWNIQLKLTLVNVVQVTQSSEKAALSKIFRGGFHLDNLYADKLMNYQVLHYHK